MSRAQFYLRLVIVMVMLVISLVCWLAGNYIFAQQALEWGLVNEVLSPEDLLPRAIELATSNFTSNLQHAYRSSLPPWSYGHVVTD